MALGEKLRQAREALDLTPGQVAEATHMMVQLVEEIEHEDFHRIAAVIYGKGFIRLYAEQVGLEPEPLIREYLEKHTGSGGEPKDRFVTDGNTVAPRSEPDPQETGTRTHSTASPDSPLPAQSGDFPLEGGTAPLPEDNAVEDDSEPDLFSLAQRRAPSPAKDPAVRDRKILRPHPPAPVREPVPVSERPGLERGIERTKRWLTRWGRHARRRIGRTGTAITKRLNTADPALRRIFAMSLVGVFVLIVIIMLIRGLFHRAESPGGPPPDRPLVRERIIPPPQPYMD